jgi:hypothetical protein
VGHLTRPRQFRRQQGTPCLRVSLKPGDGQLSARVAAQPLGDRMAQPRVGSLDLIRRRLAGACR